MATPLTPQARPEFPPPPRTLPNNLGYASQRERAVDRGQRRADRLRRTLGGEPGLGRIPPRPKGMHHSTYERHLEQIFAADDVTGAHLEAMLARLQRRR
jgi:hypothetical protein